MPIWWKSELKSQVRGSIASTPQVVSESMILIGDPPFLHAEDYYTGLQERHGSFPLVICNMLRSQPKQDELTLSQVGAFRLSRLKHYEESLEYVKKLIDLDVVKLNFDWHFNLKEMGTEKAVEELWSLLRPHIQQMDMSQGVITYSLCFYL